MTTLNLMMTNFNYLVLSDIHLGALNTPASEILDNLTEYFLNFSDESDLAKLDVLFIAGDLWDSAIQLSSNVVDLAIPWIHRLFRWAARNDVVVRVLEGTPSHDRRQGKLLNHILKVSELEVDFAYVDQLSIEYMERFKKHILYVPDECRTTADAIQNDIELMLLEKNLQQVDIAIMHGMFKYQLGFIPPNPHVLDEEWFLSIVRGYIHIGHIHIASQYNRIIAQGSFDRLAHGEEDPKGGVLVKQINENEYCHFFIENPKAKIYKTVKVSGEVEKALKVVDREIKNLPHGSYVRIQAVSTHAIFQSFETLIKKYPLFTFSKKAVAEDSEETIVSEQITQNYVPVILNERTIINAIVDEVMSKHPLLPEEEISLRDYLKEIEVG